MIASAAKSFLMALGAAFLAHYVLVEIGSNYLFQFLTAHIVNIQIGLLAINTATLGVVLTKLRDLVEKGVPLDTFANTREEMLLSVREQMALIVAALSLLSLSDARHLPIDIAPEVFNILLLACFIYSLTILYDTAHSIFVVLEGRGPRSSEQSKRADGISNTAKDASQGPE